MALVWGGEQLQILNPIIDGKSLTCMVAIMARQPTKDLCSTLPADCLYVHVYVTLTRTGRVAVQFGKHNYPALHMRERG